MKASLGDVVGFTNCTSERSGERVRTIRPSRLDRDGQRFMMKVVAGIRNQTLSPLIDICRADPRRTPGGLPARFRIRRAFFALAFLARLNVPFTVRAHPFMARQCSSTARLRQQLVLAGPLRATRA